MEVKHEPLKIYFLPFMATGHIIPLVNFARLVASRGEHVTIITTPSNAKLFSEWIEQDRATLGSHISIHTINFPSKEVGLPEGLENMSSVTESGSAAKIFAAANLLQQQVEAFVESNPPHVIITDMMFTWSGQLTSRKGIPRLVFIPISIFDACVMLAIAQVPFSSSNSGSAFIVPGLPHPITLSVTPSSRFVRFNQTALEATENSLGIIVDCFRELETEYAKHYEKFTGQKVWHIGPALLMLNNHKEIVNNEINDMCEDVVECLNWLDEQENDSVVYISFGSLCRFTDEQLFEIACGIEASRHKFIWVVNRKENDDNEWLPRGFENKMREEKTGVMIKGWAPQARILKHPAIGAFLTHCGWSAMTEAIGCGVPMITMPSFGDHYYREKHITQVCGFGVEVGAQEWSISPYDGSKSVVGRERIKEGVKRLMDGESEESVRVRRRAKELREKALEAVQEGGSSYTNLTTMIREIKHVVFNQGEQNNSV